jgi:hypothetical protein
MRLPFLGSPASHFLLALLSEAAQITIYMTRQRNLPSATGGLVLCNILLALFMLAYMNSLHTNAKFPRFLAYRCVGQAFFSGQDRALNDHVISRKEKTTLTDRPQRSLLKVNLKPRSERKCPQ